MISEKKGGNIDVCVIPAKPPDKKAKPKSFWHIDRGMLRFKIHFFLYVGGLAGALPFIAVFAKERLGLAASSMGVVLTSQMFLFIFTKPMIGYIADYFNRLKAIICILTVINGTCYFLLLAIPKYEGNEMTSSFAPVIQAQFNTNYSCHKLFEFQQNQINFTITESSRRNFTHNQTERGNICTLCSLDNETCVKDCEGIVFNEIYFTFIRTKNSLFDYVKTIVAPSQQLALLCDQSDYINISLCSHDAISTGYQNRSRSGNELVCSNILVSNEARKTYDAFICSILPTSFKNDIFNTCSEKNISRNGDLLSLNISKQKTVSDLMTYQFWAFCLLFSTASICANAIFTLSDTACCESIQKSGSDFGKQRLWGAIGWGSIAPLAGFINDSTGDFLASWTLMAVMLLLFLLNISKLDLVKPHFSKNILGDVGSVFKSKEFLAFELVILMNGMATGMIWFYLIWFLRAIGGSELLCGLSLMVQNLLGVIPFMFFSGWIIRKVGHFLILSAALLIYVIRFLWYSYLYNPWLVLPIEVTHGISYGLYYTVLATYGKLSSKPGAEAMTQSVIFSTHEGLGSGLGCVLAGIGFDYFGGHQTFFFASIFSACGLGLSIIMYFLIIRRHNGTVQVTFPIKSDLGK
ncbi:major facilitator superfamily domain-containing protein 6 [Nephila pilipes]|uniref:Major facilitator superfamily domain-containing protein 6 n=1 Tax=Nephila pilipes TaxID=299642 RepID=A0A8X6MJC9_NEPPI|nr:major facilitator superfamily domain-containing protein 6 [Nephila pilipes]